MKLKMGNNPGNPTGLSRGEAKLGVVVAKEERKRASIREKIAAVNLKLSKLRLKRATLAEQIDRLEARRLDLEARL